MEFTLTPDYLRVIAIAASISFHCVMLGFGAGSRRRTIFSDQFMKTNFEKDHLKYVKQPVPKQGYPDCGNGLYSDKLSYKDWFQFNLDQRAHKNYLE